MKKRMFLLWITALALTFALIFSGCPLDSEDDSSEKEEEKLNGEKLAEIIKAETNAQVYEKDEVTPFTGSGTIKTVLAFTDPVYGPIEELLDVGTVQDGKLTLNYPPSIADKYLTANSSSSIKAEPSNVKILGTLNVYLYQGVARRSLEFEGRSESGSPAIQYYHNIKNFYFSVAARISGENNYPPQHPGSHPEVIIYNIKGKAGGNRIHLLMYGGEKADGIEYQFYEWTSDLSTVPDTMKWILYD
jgi:hypothetical protein